MQFLGMEEELCHFKYGDYGYHVPHNIAIEYAKLGLKTIKKMFKGNFSTKSQESIQMQEILSDDKYCSYKMTWTVTTEDEEGNEVLVDVITVE